MEEKKSALQKRKEHDMNSRRRAEINQERNRMAKIIGHNIRFLRNSLGDTVDEFARRIDVPSYNISNYEKCLYCPTITTLIRISDIFGITVDDIVRREL